jgi:hypothetical protein
VAEKAAKSAARTLANKQRRHEASKRAVASAELALAKEWHCHELWMQAAMSTARSLANKQCRHEASECTELAVRLVERSLANAQDCHETATRTAASAELAEALAAKAFAKDMQHQQEASTQ